MKKYLFEYSIVAVLLSAGVSHTARAQQQEVWTLEKAISAASQNNHLVQIRKLQVLEQDARVREARIRRYPALNISSAYQYNVNTGSLTIPAGSFGGLPLGGMPVPMPNEDKSFELGKHHTFNGGVMAYQPVTQLGRIQTGIEVARADRDIAALEQSKAELQIKNGVEQLYYGILAVRKRMVEAEKNIEVARLKLYDVESALQSGKTVEVNAAGLNANIANEEQELLKLRFVEEDYVAEFKRLTGIEGDTLLLDEATPAADGSGGTLENYLSQAATGNIDIRLTQLQTRKSELGIQAARQSSLPEVGIMAGYTFQKGNLMFPMHSPYAGASLKWNIQDLFSNRQVITQRRMLRQQAVQNELYTRQEISVTIEKAYRKLKQAEKLIAVAQKAVSYRKQELRIENDKRDSGLNKPVNISGTEAALAKAEADLYGARMSYKAAQSELELLTGNTIKLTSGQ